MKKLYKYIVTLGLFLGSSACSDDFLEQETPHLISGDNLFQTIEGYDAALNGVYAQIRRERSGVNFGSSNNLTIALALAGTDIMYCNRPWGSERFLNDWGDLLNPGSGYIRNVFEWLYEINNACNTIIDRAALNESGLDQEELNRIVAEARTLRAWTYRHLTFLFGDVPLFLQEANGNDIRTDFERTPVATIRAQMQEDLEFGAQFLPETFINDGKIVRAVAQHYLTELLLSIGDLNGAIAAGEAAINGPQSLITGRYGVAASQPGTPFTDMFLDGNSNPSEGNTEALWVFQNEFEVANGGNGHNIMRRWLMSEYSSTSGGAPGLLVTLERGGRGQTRISATSFMLNLYDTDPNGNIIDDRGGNFAWRRLFTYIPEDPIPSGSNPGDTIFLDDSQTDPLGNRFWPFTRKWDNDINIIPEDDPASDRSSRAFNDQVYLRLADTYLLLAEAYFKNNQLGQAAALINQLRTRANAPLVTEGDLSLDFILDERARELFSEEHRRYTLLRTNKWLERTRLHNSVASPSIQDFNVLYPLPQSVIDLNLDRQISNNPGY